MPRHYLSGSPPPMRPPPSTTTVCPVMKLPAREASSTAVPATSSGSPRRRNGLARAKAAARPGSAHSALEKLVRMMPGAMLGLVPHVTGVRERRAAAGGDLRRGRLAALGLAARDDDARALQRHLHGGRPADTAAPAGDGGPLARQGEKAHVGGPPRPGLPGMLPPA